MSNRAWVTLATNDSYGLGALVLAHSLRRVSSVYPAVVLITPSVTEAMRERLRAVFAEVIIVDVLDSRDAAHLALLQRPELGITFTKIHCWNLTQYEKCVFLDADTLVVQNSDELFEREELSAAPDVGWPDCFNSGVFVFSPSAETFSRLITFAQERGSFDGGDQGLLNSFFSEWARGDINKHLPFLYNVTSAAFYSYLPALKQFGENLKIIHFIGAAKPWLQHFNFESRSVDAPEHIRGLLQLWWDIFASQVHTQLDISMVEVEEEPEPSPAQPPQDVSQSLHYQPILDPESEFPWHRPDFQIVEELPERHIDMTDIHDPWKFHRGNIPPIIEEPSAQTSERKDDNLKEIRKYAWDYHQQEHASPSNVYAQNQHEDQYWPPQSTHHHEQHHSHHDHFQHSEQPNQDYNQSHQHSEQHWSHVQNESLQQSSHSHHGQLNDHHGYWHNEATDNSQQVHHHEDKHAYYHHHPSNYGHQEKSSQLFDDHHSRENHQNIIHHIQHEPHYPRGDEKNKYHEHHGHAHQVHTYIHSDTHTHAHEVEVRYAHVLPQKKRNRRPRRLRIDVANETNYALMNGDISETESDSFEDIIPRHPYDGFYLRHRATIDALGRKICTHEIPPTPSPTLSPPDSPTPQEYETAEENQQSDDEAQVSLHLEPPMQFSKSGVAGNLARVVPGASTYEALDDLTRRQGWEAGNIDYMGADSFEKIWAKISQTLSTPRASPPKQPSPPKESSPPVLEEVKVPDSEVVKEPVSEPAEVAKEAIIAEAPAPAAPVVAPDVPLETTPVPVETLPATVVTPVTPIEAPVEAPVSKEPTVPTEVPIQDTTSDAAPVSTLAEVVSAEIPATVEVPSEIPTTVEVPVEIPATVEAAAETPTAAEASAPVAKVGDLVDVPVTIAAAELKEKTDVVPLKEAETPKEAVKAAEASPVSVTETPTTPVKEAPATDSPPLGNTPSKEQAPAVPAAKSEERRKPAGKLQLRPPVPGDALPTPDSEAEDAATLAHAIIASELNTPTVHSPSTPAVPASPSAPALIKGLTVEEPEVPTPPVGAVSLAQIGVKPKDKTTTAARIESSIAATTPDSPVTPDTPPTPQDPPKKKLVKKVVKKDAAAAGGEAPVPPPRKKEKKPKEK